MEFLNKARERFTSLKASASEALNNELKNVRSTLKQNATLVAGIGAALATAVYFNQPQEIYEDLTEYFNQTNEMHAQCQIHGGSFEGGRVTVVGFGETPLYDAIITDRRHSDNPDEVTFLASQTQRYSDEGYQDTASYLEIFENVDGVRNCTIVDPVNDTRLIAIGGVTHVFTSGVNPTPSASTNSMRGVMGTQGSTGNSVNGNTGAPTNLGTRPNAHMGPK